jgi:hypothetical protein
MTLSTKKIDGEKANLKKGTAGKESLTKKSAQSKKRGMNHFQPPLKSQRTKPPRDRFLVTAISEPSSTEGGKGRIKYVPLTALHHRDQLANPPVAFLQSYRPDLLLPSGPTTVASLSFQLPRARRLFHLRVLFPHGERCVPLNPDHLVRPFELPARSHLGIEPSRARD